MHGRRPCRERFREPGPKRIPVGVTPTPDAYVGLVSAPDVQQLFCSCAQTGSGGEEGIDQSGGRMKLEDSHEKRLSAGKRAVERLVHLVGGKACCYIGSHRVTDPSGEVTE